MGFKSEVLKAAWKALRSWPHSVAPPPRHPSPLRATFLQFLERAYPCMKRWLHFTEHLYSEIHLFGACLSPATQSYYVLLYFEALYHSKCLISVCWMNACGDGQSRRQRASSEGQLSTVSVHQKYHEEEEETPGAVEGGVRGGSSLSHLAAERKQELL